MFRLFHPQRNAVIFFANLGNGLPAHLGPNLFTGIVRRRRDSFVRVDLAAPAIGMLPDITNGLIALANLVLARSILSDPDHFLSFALTDPLTCINSVGVADSF